MVEAAGSATEAKAGQEPDAAPTEIVTFKGFNADLSCTPAGVTFQYEIGRTYKVEGNVVRCAAGGFHSCEMPLDVWNYYPPTKSRYAETAAGGAIDRPKDKVSDSKIASGSLSVRFEIRLPDFIRRTAAWIVERAAGNVGTGDSGHAAATGYRGHAAATGDRGHAAATGYRGHAAATGDSGHAAATGNSGHAAATGDSGHAAATGDRGHAAATGYYGHAAATGDSGHAAATGNYGHAAVKGKNAVAVSVGIGGTASAGEGGAISLAAYNDSGKLIAVRSAMVGQDGVEAGKTYRLDPETLTFVETEAA